VARVNQPDRDQQAELAARAHPELASQGVVGVAVTWVDNSGVTRVKGVPLARLASAAAWGIGVSPVFDAFLPDDSIVAGQYAGGPVGDLRMHPDLGRLTVLVEQPGWAWAPGVRRRQDGTLHPQDQRGAALTAVAALADAGYTARMAFEIEWTLSSTAPEFTPATVGPAYGNSRLIEHAAYLHDLLVALDRQGITVEQIHPEYGSSQFEISVAPEDPVSAADTVVLARDTIRALSLRYGLHASFSPKVLADGVGNGGHVHLSLARDGTNIFSGGPGRYGLSSAAESFAAGVLSRLPALLAIGAPSPASYLRLVPSHWAGAFQIWGLENREAAVRLVAGAPGKLDSANLEVKAFDLAANPYLVVAALIATGLAGMAARAELPEPVNVDPITLDDTERERLGIVALPATLDAATEAFAADDVLRAALGPELATTIVELRRAEAARFGAASGEDIVAAARWKY
jgi:glutamine synthetase